MICIAEIFVFRSPFEKVELIEEKVRKLESSLDNFCASILGVEDALIGIQKHPTIKIQIPNYTLTYTKNFTKNEWSFDPMISFQIHITPGTFQKDHLGRILSEISTLCKGNFHDQYFVEIASEYPLSEYATWNDLDPKKLGSFDLDRPGSIKNKNTLNHLLYLRYQLHKNLLHSLQLRKDIDSATGDAILPLDGVHNLSLFAGRMSSIEKSLYTRMLDIEKLITHFISLL